MNENMVLDDIRVLDFARYIAGPYCATLLGYLGADVVRVEKPGGSEDRYVGPVAETASAVFMTTGCNKRSLTLDLKHAQAQPVVERLVAGADVVVVNMPPAALKRQGLDYATLQRYKPNIILTTQTAYGHAGPWRDRGGFDGIGQAMSGSAYFTGEPGRPARCATPFVDISTALAGALGTMAALYQRRDTGAGQHVQASLLGTALAAFNAPLLEQAVLDLNRVPSGNRGQTTAPTDIFATRDGFVTTQVAGNGLFGRLARVIGAAEWLEDPAYASDDQRGHLRDEICARVGAWCADKTTDDVVEAMAEAGVPCGPVSNLDDAVTHPQAAAMEFLGSVDYPGMARPAPVAHLPLHMSGLGERRQASPPQPGEHSNEILREIGFEQSEIDNLRRAGAI